MLSMPSKGLFRFEWNLRRAMVGWYLAALLLCFMLGSLPSIYAFYSAAILLLTVLIGSAIHVIVGQFFDDSKSRTLSFGLTLPLTPTEFYRAKTCVAIVQFLSIWLFALLGSFVVVVIWHRANGASMAFYATILVEILLSFCIMLAVSILTRSSTATIIAMVTNNVLLNLIIPGLGSIRTVAEAMSSDAAQIPPSLWWLILGQLVAIPVVLFSSDRLMSRRRDFA